MNINKQKVKFIIALLCYSVLIAGVFYVLGYKIAYSRFEKGDSLRSQTFYATITDIKDNRLTIKGMDINDINYRGEFCFSVGEETTIEWRGTTITVDDLEIGDMIAVSFTGEVLETYPAQLEMVDIIQLLDDEI